MVLLEIEAKGPGAGRSELPREFWSVGRAGLSSSVLTYTERWGLGEVQHLPRGCNSQVQDSDPEASTGSNMGMDL